MSVFVRLVVLPCALAIATWAEPAEAQSCGSAASSSSDSSSSSTDSSSDDGGYVSNDSWNDDGDWGGSSGGGSSTSSSGPTGCRDYTDITGFEDCTRFGREWNAVWPAIRLELGPSFRRLSLDGITFGGTTYHDGNPHRFTLEASDLANPNVVTAGIGFRATVAIGRYFLTGFEVDGSFGGAAEGEVRMGDRSISAGDVTALTGGVVVGLALPVGPLRFRAEVLAGGQGVGVEATSILGDCVSHTSDWAARWVLEPRVGVELFVASWLSVDVWGGADVVNGGSLSGGLRLNLHTRAYDAVR